MRFSLCGLTFFQRCILKSLNILKSVLVSEKEKDKDLEDFEILAAALAKNKTPLFIVKLCIQNRTQKERKDDDAKQNGFFCYGSSFDSAADDDDDATDLDASLISAETRASFDACQQRPSRHSAGVSTKRKSVTIQRSKGNLVCLFSEQIEANSKSNCANFADFNFMVGLHFT